MVQHVSPSFSQTRRLRVGPRIRHTLDYVPERPQRASCPSLPLDLHRATIGSRHAFQPNPPTTTSRPSMVWNPSAALQILSLSAPPLPTPPGQQLLRDLQNG